MYELALFAGAGGGLLGSRWLLGWRTVCYVEKKAYAVEVLKARIRDGLLDDAPIWDDARTFDGRPWRGGVDIVTAGFPCQPWSAAGRQLSERDNRNLWPDTIRIVREVEPQWVLLENVTRLLHFPYVRRIFGDLAESGYHCRWDCLPATIAGAPHKRARLWIVGHSPGKGLDTPQVFPGKYPGLERDKPGEGLWRGVTCQSNDGCFFLVPNDRVWGVADGIPEGMDRFEAIGNAQVPAVVRAVWRQLTERKEPRCLK